MPPKENRNKGVGVIAAAGIPYCVAESPKPSSISSPVPAPITSGLPAWSTRAFSTADDPEQGLVDLLAVAILKAVTDGNDNSQNHRD
jgi:hypothetical protein